MRSVRGRFDLDRVLEYSRGIVSALPDATVLVVGADETLWIAEGELLGRNGYPNRAIAGRTLSQILPAETSEMLRARFNVALSGELQSFDYRTVDGRAICWIQLTPMYLGGDEPAAVLAVIQDVTERHQLTTELGAERDRLQLAEEMASFGHWELDLETQTVTLSDGSLRLLGIAGPSAIGLDTVLEYIDPPSRQKIVDTLGGASDSGVSQRECDLHSADGTVRRVLMRGRRGVDAYGRKIVTGATIDITELRAAEQKGLESETLLRQGFDASPIGMALTHPLDGRYVRVNDAFCRLVGRTRNELLGLAFEDVTHPDDAAQERAALQEMQLGTRAHVELEKRYARPDGTIVWVSLHVVPVHGPDARISAFFTQVIDQTARREREQALIEEAADVERLATLRSALADDRLVLHAQPIIELRTSQVVQQELLVRLERPDGEILLPREFLPVAERFGSIQQIDRWVTQRAIELAGGGAPVQVNLSAASVGDRELLELIRVNLECTGADPALLVFEVTETALMADLDGGREFAEGLHRLGCRFALDDFGTGYGTFTYLKHIPIDYVKIDMEFVRDLATSDADARLVGAIVTMARDLGKVTVAEGVEDAATLERLRTLGVDYAQGYYIGRPAPISLRREPAAAAVTR